MLRTLLTPRWVALSLLLAAVVVAFGWLGEWQVDRAREDRAGANPPVTTAPPMPLAELASPGRPVDPDAVGRRVEVVGTYDERLQRVVPGRRLDGRAGAWVLTPMVTGDGQVVPVVRGWVAGTAPAPPTGPVVVTGVLEPAESSRDATVRESAVAAGEVPYVGTALLLSEWDVPTELLTQAWVRLDTQDPSGADAPTPLPFQVDPADEIGFWRHLSYAAQWWVFALFAAVVFASALRADVRRSAAPAQEAGATRSGSST